MENRDGYIEFYSHGSKWYYNKVYQIITWSSPTNPCIYPITTNINANIDKINDQKEYHYEMNNDSDNLYINDDKIRRNNKNNASIINNQDVKSNPIQCAFANSEKRKAIINSYRENVDEISEIEAETTSISSSDDCNYHSTSRAESNESILTTLINCEKRRLNVKTKEFDSKRRISESKNGKKKNIENPKADTKKKELTGDELIKYIIEKNEYPAPKIDYSFANGMPVELKKCEEVDALLCCIRNKKKVVSLDISNRIFNSLSVGTLHQVLGLHQELEIFIMKNVLGKDGAFVLERIFTALKCSFARLKYLDVSGNILNIDTLPKLADFLSSDCCHNLEILIMLNTKMTTESANVLSRCFTKINKMKKLSKLKKIVLSKYSIGNDSMDLLKSNLSKFNNLEVIIV